MIVKIPKVFVVGVGPGSYEYITKNVQDIILDADIIAGYKFTLNTISRLLKNKDVRTVTMENQENIYNKFRPVRRKLNSVIFIKSLGTPSQLPLVN